MRNEGEKRKKKAGRKAIYFSSRETDRDSNILAQNAFLSRRQDVLLGALTVMRDGKLIRETS